MCVNASGLCLSKANIAPRDALSLHWGLAAWHWGIKSPQPLALSEAYSFYSKGLYPFSDRLTETVQVHLRYYISHLCTHAMVDAGLLWPHLRVPLTHPHAWLCCPWPISAAQCTKQSCKPPENKSRISSYCPEMRLPLPW